MNRKPHIVVVIQARMSSTRLPGKILLPLAGSPLLVRVVERVQRARVPHATIIAASTEKEDDGIEEVARSIDIGCFRGSATDLLDRHYRAGVMIGADTVVKIPSDCPLIDPMVIDRVLEFYVAHQADYDFVSNLHPPSYPDGQDVEVIPMSVLEIAWREATKPHEREHTTPFIWDQPDRFRIGNVLWETGRDLSMVERWTIDYPEDYEFARRVYDALSTNSSQVFGLDDILGFLETHPEVRALNSQLRGINWYRQHLNELSTISRGQTRFHPDEQIRT